MSWATITGKEFTATEFKNYVARLSIFQGAKFCVVHSTGAPTLQQWYHSKGWPPKRRINESLPDFYKSKKPPWHAGPHLFIDQDFIWGFTPMTVAGVHTPSWNDRSIGVEIVGNMDVEPFTEQHRKLVAAALGVIHSKMDWDPAKFVLGKSGLHFHREDPKTTHKDCPGRNVVKAQLIKDVQNYMHDGSLPTVVS
jgi:hypothetical protein